MDRHPRHNGRPVRRVVVDVASAALLLLKDIVRRVFVWWGRYRGSSLVKPVPSFTFGSVSAAGTHEVEW